MSNTKKPVFAEKVQSLYEVDYPTNMPIFTYDTINLDFQVGGVRFACLALSEKEKREIEAYRNNKRLKTCIPHSVFQVPLFTAMEIMLIVARYSKDTGLIHHPDFKQDIHDVFKNIVEELENKDEALKEETSE